MSFLCYVYVMCPKGFETKYPSQVEAYQNKKEKCKEWGISIYFFPVLRSVYKLNLRIVKAAKTYGYNRQYAWRVIRRLRKEGFEQDIVDFFKMYDDPDHPELEFWEALELRMKENDPEALTLYAKIRGFIK